MTISNLVLNKLPSKITINLTKHFVGFFDGNLYRFSENNSQFCLIPADKNFHPLVLIVSSSHCNEHQYNFPVDDVKDLKKMLALQLAEDEVSLIQQITDGQSKVNSWLFAENVPDALVRIPETLILGRCCDDGDVLKVVNNEQKVSFITQFDKVIYSASEQGVINSSERFAMSVGISLKDTQTIDFVEKSMLLANSLSMLKLKHLTAFIKTPQQQDAKKILAQTAIPVISIMTLYLILTSGYLFYKISVTEQSLNQQGQEVTELLTAQTSLESEQKRYQQLAVFWEKRTNNSGFWVVIAPIFKQASIKNITMQEDKFIIRGQTKAASALLEMISENPNVASAKFETPVRKNRNTEIFNLSFKLNKTLKISNLSSVQ